MQADNYYVDIMYPNCKYNFSKEFNLSTRHYNMWYVNINASHSHIDCTYKSLLKLGVF